MERLALLSAPLQPLSPLSVKPEAPFRHLVRRARLWPRPGRLWARPFPHRPSLHLAGLPSRMDDPV